MGQQDQKIDYIEFPGGRRYQFKDPHGNELGVWSANQ
jgi:predicted enzyme related to lactoylglutathione lyase